MKVLAITGDRNFISGHSRFDLQSACIEKLYPLFWGKGAIMPKIPKGDFDVVTSQDPFWRGLYGLYVAKRLKAKFNVQIHTDLSAQSYFRHMLAKFILRRADSIRVVSEKLKKQVISMNVKCQVHVLPVFIELNEFNSIIRRPHPKPTILWLGRYEKEKNPLEAISVLKKVLKVEKNARLIMLGEGSMKQEVIKSASNLPIIDIFDWQDPKIYFDTVDVVLCTSSHEGFGASIVEALSAGIAVVSPDVGIAKEAGAKVVPHKELTEAVIDVIKKETKGELKLQLIKDKEEWGKEWIKSLL